MQHFIVETHQRTELVEITSEVQNRVRKFGVKNGVVTVFVPHTTCGVMINEHADPDVVHDLKFQFEKLAPYNQPEYRHLEGNSDSHIKTALVGSSESIIIEDGSLVLGTWQGIFLCDFDGPRTRKIFLKIISDN